MDDTAETTQLDPRTVARAARLRYVNDRQPGYSRERIRDGFRFFDVDRSPITDEQTIARIRKLAIPPAYEDVWICRYPNGHLQAVGRDVRGRKQYRYHPRWREVRDEAKYGRMLVFGAMLPRIRERVAHDLARPGLPRQKVIAAIVRLLESTLARVGNEEYARTNKSFGLTTLRNRHVEVQGTKLAFDFRGKHGIAHHIDLMDRKLAAIVKRCRDLPGQDLFQYLDEDNQPRRIGSDDVNDYLQEITGAEITAKDFRTWAATNLAALALSELETFDTQAMAKKNIVRAVEAVSKMLGNTPAICRKCYIHPAVFDGYLDGTLITALKARADAALAQPRDQNSSRTRGEEAGEAPLNAVALTAEEVAVTAFLSTRLESVIARQAA